MINLTTISNVLNVITQKHPFFNFYHFGYPSDINTNPDNNFDPGNETGKQYPLVMWTPPSGTVSVLEGKASLAMELHFFNTQSYDNHEETTPTLLEQWTELHGKAMEFLNRLKPLKRHMSIDSSRRIDVEFDSYAHSDRLIFISLKFNLLINNWDCSVVNTPQNEAIDWDIEIASKDGDIERIDRVIPE